MCSGNAESREHLSEENIVVFGPLFPARLRARSVEAKMDACLAKISEVNRGDGYQLPYQARLEQPLLDRHLTVIAALAVSRTVSALIRTE
jgi:hypothetical protein